MIIPRSIYQTVSRAQDVHPALVESMNEIKYNNPSWQYKIFEDSDCEKFIREKFGNDVLSIYHNINPRYGAARADLFRYLLIYEMGGVYMDAKSTAGKPFLEIIKESDEYLLSHWNNGVDENFPRWGLHPELGPRGEFQNWFIIARPKHPFLRAVISRVLLNIRKYKYESGNVGKIAVLRTTGPIPYTLEIQPILNLHSYRLFDSEKEGLIYSKFSTENMKLAHEKFFPNHYRGLSEPLVLASPGASSVSYQASMMSTSENATTEGLNTISNRIREMKKEFTYIYDKNKWSYGSGHGSLAINNREYITFIQNFISANEIKTVVDFGCGDWQFSQFVDWSGVRYHGIDIVESVVEKNTSKFSSRNISFGLFTNYDDLPQADLLICKDVLQHLPNFEAIKILSTAVKKYKYMLITNDFVPSNAAFNVDIKAGEVRFIRLDKSPFNLSAPIIFSWDLFWTDGGRVRPRKIVQLLCGIR